MKNIRNVALFGLGRIGYTHFKTLLQNSRLNIKWVVEEAVDRAKQVMCDHGISDCIQVISPSHSQKVFDDPSVTLVFVCSPHATHQQIVTKALEAGKNVFCEKPLTLTSATSQACYDVARRNNRVLFCAFQKRFDPQLRSIYNKVRSGVIGNIHKVKVTSHEPPAIVSREYLQVSGGIFVDTAVHDFDLLLWMMNERPTSVYVEGHAYRDLQQECKDLDSVMIVMKFASGAIGSVDIDRSSQYGFDQRVEISGDKGVILSQNPRQDCSVLLTQGQTTEDGILDSFLTRWAEAYVTEVDHMINLLDGEATTLDVAGDDVVFVNKLAEACLKSYQQGEPIKV